MTCGCRKAEGCRVRLLATEYEVDVQRFAGARRRFAQDFSHPEIVYEPGKCIMCDACVRIAAEADEALGLATVGRGFDVAIAVPFDQPLSEGLRKVARECAESCPTAALALRGSGCASSGCASCALTP
jgi:NADH dehydrogenase/NADH:ubiquinone oxidoreductase subunit G